MKILFCNKYSFPFSGTEVYLFELMDLLRSRGHEVALFSMADPRTESKSGDKWLLPHIDFKDDTVGIFSRAKLAAHAIYSTDARCRVRQVIAEFRPDIAHIRNIYHHLSPSILWELKAQGIPVLYHLNDFKLLCPAYNLVTHGKACENPCTGQYWRLLHQGCYIGPSSTASVLAAEAYVHHWLGTYQKCVDHYLTPSRFAKELLVKNGFDSAKISVLPHFQSIEVEGAPAAANAPVLYFGRLSPEKGVSDLVRAVQALPQIRLQIAGAGPDRAALEQLAQELKLSNVEFTGHVEGQQLDQMIAASRFTILPSHAYETLGKSILESYARGRAVVASDLGSRRELVHQNETGLLFESGNVGQLTDAISYLAQRPQLAREMGGAGRRWVEAHHSPENHYSQLMQLYEQMVSLSSRPAVREAPVRVAFIGGRGVISKYSGIEAYYEEVGARLAQMGYAITVYCRTHFTPPLPEHKGMRLVHLPAIRSKHLETATHTFLSTMHAICSDCDIVHYHALGPALFSFLPRLFGKRTVVTVQGLDWKRKKWGQFASLTLRLGELAAVHYPNTTMVVSKTLQHYYRNRYGVETAYIPNGAVIREKTTLRRLPAWGLEPGGYILFLGRLSPEKNCHLLIEAYKQLDTPIKLMFAGGSSHTDSYAAQLRQHQSDRIRFLSWVAGEELDELLTHAALFVLPSDLEGLSLALLDAMAAGVCVLTSDISENREVVEDTGFTFRTGDVNDLARMLGLLLPHPEMRSAAARVAKQKMQQQYHWPQIAAQIGQAYDQLAGRSLQPDKRKPTRAQEPQPQTRGRVA
jgi:glycosyltransferase involved in cell wall biosynthesis